MTDIEPPQGSVRPKLIAVYLDETKKLQDVGQSVVFAGCAAASEDWDEFIRRWRVVIGPIRALKMTSALVFRGEFYGWKDREGERDELLYNLAVVIHEAPILKISAPILAGEFESLPQSQRRKLKDPQYCEFETCVRGIINRHPNDVFQINCDLTYDYAEGCVAIFNKLRDRHPELQDRLVGIAFGNDKFVPPLQAADMIAYCARAIAEEERFGVRAAAIVHRISDLFESRGSQRSYFSYRAGGDGLGSADAE